MPEIPPWITAASNYDPVGAYIRSYQIGASIGEAQTRIAEQQRQANMEHAAKQQAMQANILKAQQEMLLEKAYKDQQLSLENARLTEMQQRNAAEAQHAAAVLRETEARNAIQAAMATRRMTETERHNRATEERLGTGKDYGDIITEQLPGGATAAYRPGSPGLHILPTGTDKIAAARQMAADKADLSMAQRELQNARAREADPNLDPALKAEAGKKAAQAAADYAAVMGRMTNAPIAAATTTTTAEKFNSEDEARKAGHKAGDVVYIIGVGKVRLN